MAGGTIDAVGILGNKTTTDSVTNTDQNTQSAAENQNDLNIVSVIGGSRTFNDSVNSIDSRVTALEAAASEYKEKMTDANGGEWFDVKFISTTQVALLPKEKGGFSWMAKRLNDGSYIEDTTSSSLTRTLDTTTLDGIGAKQNNSKYEIIVFENSSGDFDFDFMFWPETTISAANPTNDITLTQLNGNDIRSLYPVGEEVGMWQPGAPASFEVPDWDTTGVTYTPTSTDMEVASYPAANQIRLSANLTVTNFTTATICYLLDGLQPIDCTTETIHTDIGARGWDNTGITIRTDGSGNIIKFIVNEEDFLYDDGTGAAEIVDSSGNGYDAFTMSASYANYRLSYCPPNRTPIIGVYQGNANISAKSYHSTYGQWIFYPNVGFTQIDKNYVQYSIINIKTNAGTGYVSTKGYKRYKGA